MVEAKSQELIDWAIERLQSYDNEKKLYNVSSIILSILDVICGIIAIFYTGMLVTSVVASIACGAIWSGRFVQLVKTERLAKSIKVLTGASLAYIAVRKKRSEYMKNFFKNIKNNPLTIIFALLGGAIMGFSAFKLAQLYLVALPLYAYVLLACGCGILTMVIIFILGWDSVKSTILRTAKKNLSSENYDKVVDFVGTLEEQQSADVKAKAEAEAHQLEVEKARATVEEYEKAKKILEESANNAPTETPQNQ